MPNTSYSKRYAKLIKYTNANLNKKEKKLWMKKLIMYKERV